MTNRNGVPEMEQEDVRTESGVSPEEVQNPPARRPERRMPEAMKC